MSVRGDDDRANERLDAYLRERPLVLNIETTNICNALCCFCAYPKLKRGKHEMTEELYAKIVRDYAEMGGGALILTPIVGDFFLDSQWKERLRVARSNPSIGMISVTTNAIALSEAADDDLRFYLVHTDFTQISLGGTTSETYFSMFGVDQFEAAVAGARRLAKLRNQIRPSYPLRVGFRVADAAATEASPLTHELLGLGFEVAIESEFGNWGGSVRADELPVGALLRRPKSWREKRNPCFVFFLGLFVASSGKVTVCGCMDANVDEVIGDCNSQNLADIWKGQVYREIKKSFGTPEMPSICKRCSFYEDGVEFSRSPEMVNFVPGRYPFTSGGTLSMFERRDVKRKR